MRKSREAVNWPFVQLEGLLRRSTGRWRLLRGDSRPVSAWTAMGMKPHPLFEAAWYIDVYSDVAEAGVNPLVHYLEIGGPEGRFPNPFFDGNWYQQQDEHLLQTRGNPLTHYVTVGAAQGRRPSPHFDPTSYPMQIPATTGLEMDQLSHFIVYGWGRNRRACGRVVRVRRRSQPPWTH